MIWKRIQCSLWFGRKACTFKAFSYTWLLPIADVIYIMAVLLVLVSDVISFFFLQLIYESFARYLVEHKGYDKDLLNLTPATWDFWWVSSSFPKPRGELWQTQVKWIPISLSGILRLLSLIPMAKTIQLLIILSITVKCASLLVSLSVCRPLLRIHNWVSVCQA